MSRRVVRCSPRGAVKVGVCSRRKKKMKHPSSRRALTSSAVGEVSYLEVGLPFTRQMTEAFEEEIKVIEEEIKERSNSSSNSGNIHEDRYDRYRPRFNLEGVSNALLEAVLSLLQKGWQGEMDEGTIKVMLRSQNPLALPAEEAQKLIEQFLR